MPGFYIYSDNSKIAAELVGFAKASGQAAAIIAFTAAAAAEMSNSGADKVFCLSGESPLAENYSKAVAEFLQGEAADLFLVGATARGRDLAARVAGYLDCAMASDVSAMSFAEGQLNCERTTYGGAIVQSEVLSGLSVVTVPGGKYDAASGKSEQIIVDVKADPRMSLVDKSPIVKTGADLNAADKVVCIGLGLEKQPDLEMARELAGVLGAELGCTRGIAEERHWLPVQQYIGISGAIIKPQLYLSMGVSGQVQHVFGIREAKNIVAVDSNDKAPIFKSADYGIVGDMYEIIPLLTEALRK